MSKFLDILQGKIPEYSGAIIEPIKDPKITVIESKFDGTKETDWMHIQAPEYLYDTVVKDWAEYHSGLSGWKIGETYPHRVGDHYEWRLRR